MDSLIVKKEQIHEMLDSLGFHLISGFSVETNGRVLKLSSNESNAQTILQVPLQEDYSYDIDLCICNIVLNISKNYFKGDQQLKSLEAQKEKIDLIITILKDLNLSVYDDDSYFSKKRISNNIFIRSLYYCFDIKIEISSTEIAVVPKGIAVSPCKIFLCNQFSYSVLKDICSFILVMAKRMKDDYDYLNNMDQWI